MPGRNCGNAPGRAARTLPWVSGVLRRGIFRAGILGQGLSEARGDLSAPSAVQGCPELPGICWRWAAARQDGPSVHLSIPPGSAPSICPSSLRSVRLSAPGGIRPALAAAGAGRVRLRAPRGCRAQPRSRLPRGTAGSHPGAVPGGAELLRTPPVPSPSAASHPRHPHPHPHPHIARLGAAPGGAAPPR